MKVFHLRKFICLPKLKGRGSGLGNELIPWGKALLAAEAVNGIVVDPVWSLNPRKYYRNVRTSRFDWVLPNLLEQAYPFQYSFTQEEYLRFFDQDFGCAFAKWVEASGINHSLPSIVFVEGMWGGYGAISRARPHLLAKLLGSHGVARNVAPKLPRAGGGDD
jgi:hypothetical protein